jgi:hypothetical protein
LESAVGKSFTDISKEIAKDFLQTTVFVDEQAYFEKEEVIKKLTKPTRGSIVVNTDDTLHIGSDEDNHTLNAKEVIDAFASEGIVCSVIKPSKGEQIVSSNIIKTITKADALILDWDIYSDEGEIALEIIRYILSNDDNLRLRLIFIYSGARLSSISEKLSKTLSEFDFESKDEFTFTKGHSRISIFSKEKITDTSPDKSRTLYIEDIPDRLALEFVEMTAGLVSNVTLKSMSVLRKNTHLLLAKLGPEMDPPYLTHRCLLPYPEDAKGHIVDLISDEFRYLLNNSEVDEGANLDIIDLWMEHSNPNKDFNIYHLDGGKEISIPISKDHLLKLLEEGYDKTRNAIKYTLGSNEKTLNQKGFKQLSKTFDFIDPNFDKKDCKFSILTSQKSNYGSNSEGTFLTQGSILKGEIEGHSNSFWLCIRQKCDCVRLTENTFFSFVPLEQTEDNKAFELVVLDENDNHVKLKINYDIHETRLFKFEPTSEGVVKGNNENGILKFTAVDGNSFTWVSELKDKHALRISANIVANIARLGLDESEWQRRWSRM